MRLINVETFQFLEIQKPDDDHLYAILSHTWGRHEVAFQEFFRVTRREGFSKEALKDNARYSKIVQCCAKAEFQGFEYVWIDTCCIDNTSSSELSEAINSMYQWYSQATVCYVYLFDVESGPGEFDIQLLGRSRWFTRGWTLQELIAPRHVRFFNRHCADIGTKLSLRQEISKITGVPVALLAGSEDAPLNSFCIAQRMSWAAKRKTTRDEDIAYCLMGIFDVNMPILYGEGKKAFIRLQEEILKQSDDESLLAWVEPKALGSSSNESYNASWNGCLKWPSDIRDINFSTTPTSVFAPSPAYFRYGQSIRRIEPTEREASPFSVTNKGLHIWLPLILQKQTRIWDKVYVNLTAVLAILGCKILNEESSLAIILVQHPSGRYIRVHADYLCRTFPPEQNYGNELPSFLSRTELYIDSSIPHSTSPRLLSSTNIKPSVVLRIINCNVLECGDAWRLDKDPVYLFALMISNRSAGIGDALVILSLGNGFKDKAFCWVDQRWVDQPQSSARFSQILLEWWTNLKDQLEKNTLDSIGTDRASLDHPNGHKITVSVDIDPNSRYTVAIQWADRQGNHLRTQPRYVVSEQQEQHSRVFEDIRKRYKYKEEWGLKYLNGPWTIFSKEVSCLPKAKRHYLGDLELISGCV